jgi:hypothetical protein
MDARADEHAITDVINGKFPDILIVIGAVVNDDFNPLKRRLYWVTI